MDDVKEWLAWRGVPNEVGIRVRRYYEHYYQLKGGFDEKSIFENLSPELQATVLKHVVGSTMHRLPAFQLFARNHLSNDMQMNMFPMLKPYSLPQGTTIFNRGDVADVVFFLVEGKV